MSRYAPKRLVLAVAGLVLVGGVGACNSGGGITIPTLPTSITLPTLPTRTESTRTETNTVTVTTTERPGTRTITETTTVRPSSTTTTVPAEPTSGGIATWVWVVLALLLLLLIALVVWLVRRTQQRAAWDNRLTTARQTASWVEDSLVPQVMSRPTTSEASATWRAAGPRLLNVDEELHELASTAPDPERARDAGELRSRLGALGDAVGADTATSASASADDLRVRRAAIQQARTQLRQFLDASAPQRRH